MIRTLLKFLLTLLGITLAIVICWLVYEELKYDINLTRSDLTGLVIFICIFGSYLYLQFRLRQKMVEQDGYAAYKIGGDNRNDIGFSAPDLYMKEFSSVTDLVDKQKLVKRSRKLTKKRSV
ncbi:hypothetical protein ACMZOO_00200 [Catenovulum sp. SX2]|uniref:hypothetical protein n=1 Tax=Catenovulum sp. SX2 TaxID=3398614 RepID=UPI003F853220